MLIKYVFNTKDFAGIAAEIAEVLESLKSQVVEIENPSVLDIQKEPRVPNNAMRGGQHFICIRATMTPAQVNRAMENEGYVENNCVGVNNTFDQVIFKDDVNDMYIINHVAFLIKTDGLIYGEYSQAPDEHDFQMFTDF